MAGFTKVLVGTDFSAGARAAADAAVDLARAFGGSVTVATVIPLTSSLAAATALHEATPAVFEFERALERHSERELHAEQARLADRGVPVEHKLLEGPVALTLADEAGRGYDLLVVGTHGRGAVERLALGSVAERVVRLSPVPVLTLRPLARG